MVKDPPVSVGDVDSILGLGRSPGEGNGNPAQYSCLENPVDRGAWWAIVYRVQRVRHDLDFTSHSLIGNRELLNFCKVVKIYSFY